MKTKTVAVVNIVTCCLVCTVLIQGSLGHYIQSIVVPHTAKPGYKLTTLQYVGQKFNVLNDDNNNQLFKNISHFFTILPNGCVITNSHITELIGMSVRFIVNNELGTKSWQDTIQVEIKGNHSTFVFSSMHYEGHVRENLPPNTVVEGLDDLFVRTDADVQEYVKYAVVSRPASRLFQAVRNPDDSVSLLTKKHLDREKMDCYIVKIKAWRDIPHYDYTYTNVTVFVDDENDNIPYFPKSDYHVSISNDLPPLSTVFGVQAVDPDIGKLTYSMKPSDSALFSLDPDLSNVILKPGIKLQSPEYHLKIFATDPDGKVSKPVVVRISVDGALKFTPERHQWRKRRNVYHSAAKEAEIPESYIGDLLEFDNNAYDRFELKEPAPEMLEINRVTGTIRLKDGFELDYETQPEIEVTVIITQTNDLSCKC